MQSVSFRIWTRVAVSISHDDNDYTTGISKFYLANLIENQLIKIRIKFQVNIGWYISIYNAVIIYIRGVFNKFPDFFVQAFKISCLNFWDEACWFLSFRFFGLLSSSLFPQRSGRYVLRPSSGVRRTREPSRNFELRPLLKPRGSPVLIPFAITGHMA